MREQAAIAVSLISAAPPAASPVSEVSRITIESRFGPLHYDPAKTVTLPKGLLGFVDYREFILAEIPNREPSRFKLLQCTTDASLSLIVLPLLDSGDIIKLADREDACHLLGLALDQVVFLLVVTIRHMADSVQLSVNARAPLIIDSERQIGYQHVLSNSKYEVRHTLD